MAKHPARKAKAEANRAAREKVVARILALDDRGVLQKDIAKEVGKSDTAISYILVKHGRRKRVRGVVHTRYKFKQVRCVKCDAMHEVRSDRKEDKAHCSDCRLVFRKGIVPHNIGQDNRIQRQCIVCGTSFLFRMSRQKEGPLKGKFCSKLCWGVYQSTPGSRYSEVGKNYPSRRPRS